MPSAVPSSLVDRVLDGRYRVLSHIADGGMASVYVALDLRLDREVALKVMRPDLVTDPTFVSRFRREARSAARLSHPHVVAVYDQGEDDGHMFLAMELVSGQTLRQVMQAEGPLTPRAALDIMDPVLQALHAAHSAGIIHRDVKPENVILREDGTVKVADFGLARAVTTATATAATGVLLGTVAYLSPEQVERGVADARSDVYAAGLLLFEMLTGGKAFTGDSPIHVAYQHVHSDAPAPSSRVDGLAPELDALVARATARDPDNRPSDAGAFLAELRHSRKLLSAAQLDLRPGRTAGPTGVSATVALPRTQQMPTPTTAPTAAPAAELTNPAARRRRWPLVALAALLLASAAAALWFFTAGPGGMTTVPTLVRLTQQDAEQALSSSSLGADVVKGFSETVRAGVVISTDPPAGTDLRRSSRVRLTVSQGPERYDVPTLAGRTVADAEGRLQESRLSVGDKRETYDDAVPEGQVISTTPAAGASLKPGTAVSLVVSKGRQPVTLANWTGKPADLAVKALTAQGLKVDATAQENSDTVPKAAVLSQSPSGGTVYRGDAVVLVVSKGPVLVQVPDVTGKQERVAKRLLEGAGFKVAYSRFMGGIFGTVRSQTPPGLSMQPKGSTITLTVV